MLSNDATPSKTGTVISSSIQYANDWFPKEPWVVAIMPFFNVIVLGVVVMLEVSTKNPTVALDAVLDLGSYPMFLASETTFSLNVALSIKTSFATMFALYEVM